METFSTLDLIGAHGWSQSFFTTYALSLSFFEAVVLDALVRQNVERTLILADVSGVRAAVEEYGSRCAGRVYEVEPVAVERGCFHPKLAVLTSSTEARLVVGSGNLTFGGWGSNLECVEHLHPGIAGDAFDDAADFLESLATAPWIRHHVQEPCASLAVKMRQFASTGVRNGNIRLLHSLDRSLLEQLFEFSAELGGAERVTLAAPFHDGVGLDRLCSGLGLDHAFVHSHDGGTVAGTFGLNWPAAVKAKVLPVAISSLAADARRLHAKAVEIICRRGRIVLSGSANATVAALDRGRNVEVCVARIQRNPVVAWHVTASSPPVTLVGGDGEDDGHTAEGVLRAILEGDQLKGWMVTPFPAGRAVVSRVTASGVVPVGETLVSGEGEFTLTGRDIEREAWTAHRLILKVTSSGGVVASGFVSFGDFVEIKRHLGSVASRLFAVLAGTETPDDVAAVMGWFHEHPEYLSTGAVGGGGSQKKEARGEVAISGLLEPNAVELGGGSGSESLGAPNWRRFVDLILACFRQPRGPITPEDDDESTVDDEIPHGEGSKPPRARSNPERPLNFLDRLFDGMLAGSHERRSNAFWLAHYVCDRLDPDPVRVKSYLDKLMTTFVNEPPLAADREAMAAAALVWVADSAVSGMICYPSREWRVEGSCGWEPMLRGLCQT